MASPIEMENGQTSEPVGLDAESYTPTYKEAFPPLASTPTTNATGEPLKGAWGTQRIQSSTVTQIFTVPLEERRYRGELNEPFGESKQTQICRSVMEKTGSSIQLSLAKDQSLTFVLSGKPEMVQKAKRHILSQVQTQYTVEVKIAKEHHRFILGQKYQNLKQLELSTETKITVPKSDDPSDVLKIAGTKDGVERARHEIQLIADEKAKLAFERVNVPKVFHPWIMGNWLKQAQSVTGARINIPPPSIKKDELTIAGEKEAVAKAKAMVLRQYEEKQRKATSVSVQVKKSQHKHVCGLKRNNIQEIMEQFDVSVEVPAIDDPSETITLRGEPDKLGLALTKVYEKANSVVTAEVNAPRWLHRFIIGRKGQNINKINLPQVHIEFSSDQDQIQLEGPPAEVETARSALESFTTKLMETMDFAVVEVDQKYHRHIIGKGGANVNRIKRETGTSIVIPSDEERSRSIRIEGSPAGVVQAKRELLELAAKLENERTRDVKLEHRFHRQVIGAQGQHIKEIRAKFEGISITFPDSKSGSDIVSLKGPQASVEKCHAYFKKLNGDLVDANFVAEVRVFKQFHKNVIGKGGAMIKKIRDDTQTKIDMPTENSDSDVIIVTGRKENVEEARKQIEAIQNEQANVTSVEVAIPPKLHQAVLGPKGRLVRAISDECGGVLVRFPTAKQVQAGSDKVIVRGPKDDVENAKKQLMELATERALENFSGEVKAKPEYHRYLIGRGGANIKKLREQTGARIIFPSEKDEDRSMIVIIGKEEAVEKAKERLEKLVKDLENISEAEVSVPHKFHRHFIMRRGQVLQDLADQFGGVSISFPKGGSTSEKVVLKGAKDCVEGARARILEIVEDLDSQETVNCEIPHKHHRSVLGPRGFNVQQIGADFGVTIKFPERSNEDRSDVITITGKKEKAEEAREALLQLVPVTEEVEIPFDCHRFIIGSRGKDVRQMMEEHGVQILVPPSEQQSNYVAVTGPHPKVAQAIEALRARVVEIEAQKKDRELKGFKLSVCVNARHHPRIIGRRGATISEIRSEFDVNIQFPDRNSDDADVITITGYENRAEQAKEAILKIVEELEKQVTKEIEIDQRVHSRLIGFRGKAIRKVMDDYEVEIRFPRDKDSGIVSVTGAEEKVEDALDYLLNREEEYLQDEIERLDEQEMQRQYQPPSASSRDRDSGRGDSSSSGFVVRDAPWNQPRAPPSPMNTDEFPSIQGAATVSAPLPTPWGAFQRKS